MIHHIVLYKPKADVTAQQLEVIMMQTRIQLLKISFASNVRCGRRIDKANEWAFFVAIDFDSKERLAMFHDDAIYIKFVEEIIKPNMATSLVSTMTVIRSEVRNSGAALHFLQVVC